MTAVVKACVDDQAVKDKALPLQPNAETVEAIEAARRGEFVTIPDGRLIESLNEDD